MIEPQIADGGTVKNMHLKLHFICAVTLAVLTVAPPAWAMQSRQGASATNSATFEQDGIRVVASIHAQIYSWAVTNVDAPPIMRFSIPEQNTYNQNYPPGWQLKVQRGVFTAYTDDPQLAIFPGQTRIFDARTGSAGSMLGPASLTMGFSADGDEVVIQNVWAPVPKRRSIVVLVATTLILLGFLHVAAMRRMESARDRSGSSSTASGPRPSANHSAA